MALNDISLASGLQINLMRLRTATSLSDRTAVRLSTGRRINGPIDGAESFFLSKNQERRAQDLAGRKDGMNEALQTIAAASTGIDGMLDVTAQMRALLGQARETTDPTSRADLAAQYDTLMQQAQDIAQDAAYGGRNLLGDDDLVVNLNETGSSQLTISGFDATTDLSWSAAQNAWAGDTDIDAAESAINSVESELRGYTVGFGHNNGVLSARASFAEHMIATLQTGSARIVEADPNEESANMLTLQTRQQLAVQAISIVSQGQQAVLSFFR